MCELELGALVIGAELAAALAALVALKLLEHLEDDHNEQRHGRTDDR